MSRGAACGPPFGMGLDVESSGAGAVVPPGLWFLLGLRVCDGPVGGEYSTCVLLGQGVRVTFEREHHPIPFLRPFDSAQGERNSPHRWMGSCLRRNDGWGGRGEGGSRTAPTGKGGSRLGGGCAFRRDGFSKLTNEVQHLVKVLSWERVMDMSPLKRGVRLPDYKPRDTRSAKSRQVWIARHLQSKLKRNGSRTLGYH